ncbi:phage portal protein [Actinomadura fulvescens]|uniref:Phage portal protein n=1 Tax=Actinomadura fulvescens TaxID=46160 RepID=A0ABN3Q6T7_9ACTN
MPLDRPAAIDTARALLRARADELPRLDRVYRYTRGEHASVYVPKGARDEYRWIVERSVRNITRLIVTTVAQALHVEGYRPAGSSENAAPWAVWQANRMDARQHGVHRAALKYGLAYTVVLPGDPTPVIKRFSPRRMTAVYADVIDDEWPIYAVETFVERTKSGTRRIVRVYDDQARYSLLGPAELDVSDPSKIELTPAGEDWVETHGLGVCPVVRYLNVDDLDEAETVTGEVEPIIAMQDALNLTAFNEAMAQQFGAFRQRWATGMITEVDETGNPTEPFRARVDAMLTAESADTKFGEFGQTDLTGFHDSFEATLRYVATVTQTPPHALLGQMANLSAEALDSARDGLNSKIGERKSTLGESHEQTLRLAGLAAGDTAAWSDTAAQVVWRDVGARSLAQTVDAWGKAVQMLGIPAREVWERIPGVSQTDVQRWQASADEGDAFARLNTLLDRQLDGPPPGADQAPETPPEA